jgi:hypothetical protein
MEMDRETGTDNETDMETEMDMETKTDNMYTDTDMGMELWNFNCGTFAKYLLFNMAQ